MVFEVKMVKVMESSGPFIDDARPIGKCLGEVMWGVEWGNCGVLGSSGTGGGANYRVSFPL